MTTPHRLAQLRQDVEELTAKRAPSTEVDFSAYRADPAGFIRDVLGEIKPGMYEGQLLIAEAVRDHPLTVVRSCNSAGKDWVAARLALWWVFAMGGYVLITGPTERQVREIVMNEVRKAFMKSRALYGELFTMSLRLDDPDTGILAFTSHEASSLTGFHAPRLLVIITEGQGVEDFCFEAMLANAAGEDDRICVLGNPLAPTGRFFAISRSAGWHSIRLSAEDHPNVRTGTTVIPGAVTRAQVQRIAQEYGKESSIYRSRVLAEFPTDAEESLVTHEWLDAAEERWEDAVAEAEKTRAKFRLSLDPARHGSDSSVLAIARNGVLVEFKSWTKRDTMHSTGRVIEEIAQLEYETPPQTGREAMARRFERREPLQVAEVTVDAVGLGSGVYDRLKEQDVRGLVEFNGARSATGDDSERFLNTRASSFWHLRSLLERGLIALPHDPELREELVATQWRISSSGRIQIEAKDDLRARLGRSPDKADALAMVMHSYERSGRRRRFGVYFEGADEPTAHTEAVA